MAHLALYREFRPQRFADVVGQQHITRTLRHALIQNRIHHAYLLSGPRGTGKTSVARILAKAVNCLNLQDGEPCNECKACQSIISGETMDVIEIDAASNRGIDEIRDLRDRVKYAPVDLKMKVYIIDEVHMLSEPAFNALLKTLEEPPRHVVFVLATTEKHKLPVTIVSRCQSFEYHRLSNPEIVARLADVCQRYGLQATDEALAVIARQAEGGMRDALSLLDQVMAYAVDNQISLADTLNVLGSAPVEEFLKMDGFLVEGNVGGALLLLDELVRQGKDLRQFVRDYLTHMRDFLLLKVDPNGISLDLHPQSLEALKRYATMLTEADLLKGIKLIAELENEMRFASSPRLLVEVGLIRLSGLYTDRVEGTAEVRHVPPAPQPEKRAPRAEVAPEPVLESTQPADPANDAESTEPKSNEYVAASPELERVVEVWDQVLDLIKRKRPSTHMLLSQTRVGRVRGRIVVLVAPNAAFADLLKRAADQDIIQKAFAKAGLADLEIQPVSPDDPLAKPETGMMPEDQSQTKPAERTLMDVARSVFPKELVHEVKEEDPK